MNSLEVVLEALRKHDCEPKATGSYYMAHCPAHDDGTPSLKISQGTDGRTLINCFACCAPEQIMKAIGLTTRDLFNGVIGYREQHMKGMDSFLFRWRRRMASTRGPRPTTRLVLFALSLSANKNGANCFPSQRLLRKRTGLSSRSIVDHLRVAELHGWIVREKRRRPGQAWKGFEYYLDIPADADVDDDDDADEQQHDAL